MSKTHQVAAIPVRRKSKKAIEVLLVTSRETRRWVVPKGWPWPKHPDHEAAAGEAWEEAGVRGKVRPKRIGTYTYDKRSDKGAIKPLEVSVYVLDVTELAKQWPESAERRREWFSPAEAAEAVDEPELKALLIALESE